MNKQTYHFGLGVDANYVKYAGVLMTNLLLQHLGQPLVFHVACDGINAEDQKKLSEFERLYNNVQIKIYDVSERLNQLNPVTSKAPTRLNRSVLLRILLPELVGDIERLVYMDVDMLCLKRLDELWQLPMGDTAIAAVMCSVTCVQMCKRLGLKHNRYFNAGLMVINIAAWRAQQLTKRVLEYFQLHSANLQMLEQDALNCVLDGDFLELEHSFNHMIEPNNPLVAKYSDNEHVLHFVNEAKPWTKGCLPEIYDLYWSYVRRSLWYDIQQVEPNTIKAAFLAAVTAELNGQQSDAIKYYSAVARRLMEHYIAENRKELLDMEI